LYSNVAYPTKLRDAGVPQTKTPTFRTASSHILGLKIIAKKAAQSYSSFI